MQRLQGRVGVTAGLSWHLILLWLSITLEWGTQPPPSAKLCPTWLCEFL